MLWAISTSTSHRTRLAVASRRCWLSGVPVPTQPIPALLALHVVSGLLYFAPCYFVPSHILYVMYYLFLCLLLSASPSGIQASRKQGFLCWLPCGILGAQSRAPPVMTVHGRMNVHYHSGFVGEVIKNQKILPKVTQNFKRGAALWTKSEDCLVFAPSRTAFNIEVMCSFKNWQIPATSFISLGADQNQERKIWRNLLVSGNWL